MHIGLLTPSFASRRTHGRGLTLTEVLIAVTITLVLMAVLVNAFRDISGQISESRAIIQLAGQLRATSDVIREDLRGVTLPLRPWVDPSEGLGYFEQAEFIPADFTPDGDNLVGDIDDVLMFTTRSTGAPFRGRLQKADGTLVTIESPLAEVVIWTRLKDENNNGRLDRELGEVVTLHRRTLLIRPDLNDDIEINPIPGRVHETPDLIRWYQTNDLSVHVANFGTSGLKLVANSLGDLSKRECRFAHDLNAFPYPLSRDLLNSMTLRGNFAGEDVLLSDLIAFDTKLFDPNAPVYSDFALQPNGTYSKAIIPGDNAYESLLRLDFSPGPIPINEMAFLGSYVNPGYMTNYNIPSLNNASYFSGQPQLKSQMGIGPLVPPNYSAFGYDTWPKHYETDGVNQDALFEQILLTDEGTDGFDSPYDQQGPNEPLANGADDAAERETSPPYPVPLRGIEIRIRLVEPTSQQVRQTSVAVDFEN